MVRLLEHRLSGMGAEISIQEVSPGRCNLIACFQGRNTSRSLMLEAHSDTVQIDGMTISPFEPLVQNGRLYGRGACDNKGSMTAMLLALEHLLEQEGKLPLTVFFVSTCDEELGAGGAHHLIRSGFRTDAAIVGEPTDLELVCSHKGVLRWRLRTLGVSAHSSDPSQGVNAIYRMRRVLTILEDSIAPALRNKTHPLLGHPALSVGTIQGGSQVNMVPSYCEIEIDRRLLPDESREEIAAELSCEIEQIKRTDSDFAFTLEESEYYPPFEQGTDAPVVQALEEACHLVLGEAHHATAPWGATAGIFKAAGIPSVLFGPGSIRQAHTAEEYIELEQVVKAAKIYAKSIEIFAHKCMEM